MRPHASSISSTFEEPTLIGLLPYWLPVAPDFSARIKALDALTDPQVIWAELVALADTRLDFVRTGRLDRSLLRHFALMPPPGLPTAS